MKKFTMQLTVAALLVFGAMLLLPVSAFGQSGDTAGKRQIGGGNVFFVPHWYFKAQGGAAYDIGESDFIKLVSPAVQLAAGFQPHELFNVRLSVNGFWARNRYVFPDASYRWNFVQASIDAELDLMRLFAGSDPARRHHPFLFVGGGASYSFGNDDAAEADKRFGIDFQKRWVTRWNPVVRAGIGYDYYITDDIAIGAEMAANMLPDHFNSKKGRSDNKDWHFTALVGVKFNLGKRYGRTEPVYEEPAPVMPKVVEKVVMKEEPKFVDVPIEKISFNVNIHFVINQSVIRSNQTSKLTRLINYLNNHPKAFVRLSGYADKDTGTPAINLRLSRERASAVSTYLQDHGIEEWRIRRFAKGDKVQPFDIPEDNRVCICFVYDPDNPVPIENW